MLVLFNILLMIFMNILSPVNCQIQIRDTLLAGQVGANHTIALTGYGPTDYIQAQLTVTNGVKLSTISMILNFQRTVQISEVPIEFFEHKDPKKYISFDLDAMWNARQQYVNMRMYANSHVYVTVFNFDPVYRQKDISYLITIGPPASNYPSCQQCSNLERTDSDCYCRNCKFRTFGKICSRTIQTLPSNIELIMSPYSFQYFTVLNSDRSIIEINISGQAQLYLQYQSFPDEVASYYNAMKDSRYAIKDTLKIVIESSNLNLLITIASFSNHDQNVSIKYYKDNTLSLTAIVLISVFGGILLIFLVFVLIFVIRRKCLKSTRVTEQNSLPHLAENKLSPQEIQFYFPSCQYSNLIHQQPDQKSDTSLVNLNSHQREKGELECVICLQKFNEQDLIKIGYCKHIVHSHCLQTWFKKQRNCPYCRTEYSRSHTIAQYKNLVAQNNNVELKGVDLVKNIYNLQYNSIFFSLEQKKLEEGDGEQLEDNQYSPSRNHQIQQEN